MICNLIIFLQICFLVVFFFIWLGNTILYFTNFKKNIKTLYIRINPLKKFAIRMFFDFCLPFVFFILISVNMTFFINFYKKCMLRKIYVSSYSFVSKVLWCSFIFYAENAFNRGITTDYSFFSIKLIWLTPKSDLNLIVFGFDDLVCIIVEIVITSLTYIDCLLPLINLALSILLFLIFCFASSFILHHIFSWFLYQLGHKYLYRPMFCLCQKYKVVIDIFYLHYHLHVPLLQKLHVIPCFGANINHFRYTHRKNKIFWFRKCSVMFDCFLLNLSFKFTYFF